MWERIGLIVVGLIGFPKTGGVSGTVKTLEVLGGVAASGEVWVMAQVWVSELRTAEMLALVSVSRLPSESALVLRRRTIRKRSSYKRDNLRLR